MNGIGLITHHELVALKSETTRERWEQEGKLPKPSWVRADRRRLALYPEPILDWSADS